MKVTRQELLRAIYGAARVHPSAFLLALWLALSKMTLFNVGRGTQGPAAAVGLGNQTQYTRIMDTETAV